MLCDIDGDFFFMNKYIYACTFALPRIFLLHLLYNDPFDMDICGLTYSLTL